MSARQRHKGRVWHVVTADFLVVDSGGSIRLDHRIVSSHRTRSGALTVARILRKARPGCYVASGAVLAKGARS